MSDLGATKADAEELARRYTKVLERSIYRYPKEWFWLHNRRNTHWGMQTSSYPMIAAFFADVDTRRLHDRH